MMISPEGYYEDFLKGKNEKQLMTAIRGLKQEIGRLKNALENPRYGDEPVMCPSESTRLYCTREYLERAKEALAEAGGTYKPSQAELRAANFDASIPAITKVNFVIGGFFGGYETRIVTLDGERLYFDVEHSLMSKPSNLPENCDYPYTKEEFLDGIRELHMGEWQTNYMNNDIFDGTQWKLTVEFSDGHKTFKTGGSNAYPYNFDALQELFGIDTTEDYEEEGDD